MPSASKASSDEEVLKADMAEQQFPSASSSSRKVVYDTPKLVATVGVRRFGPCRLEWVWELGFEEDDIPSGPDGAMECIQIPIRGEIVASKEVPYEEVRRAHWYNSRNNSEPQSLTEWVAERLPKPAER